MDIGIGLPATSPGPYGQGLGGWAQAAEDSGFSSLGVLDRVVHGNYEPLVALAAAAAVTTKIRLASTVLLAAYRGNTALLAKQLASIDHMAGGRLTVGLAAGGRPDDFTVSGTRYADRGRRLDALVADLRGYFAGRDGVGPALPAPPPLLLGGQTAAAMDRAARLGDGWIGGASSGRRFADLVAGMRRAWTRHGRTGRPRVLALSYFALGPDAAAQAERYVRDYYAFAGPYAERVLADVVTDAEAARARVAERAAAGCEELIFFPCVNEPDQPALLADAVLDGPGRHGGTPER
jgi:alkanesulfonate monooxygenase SsuD/methylene tetrahydromethanopterin reductase-like flavin-dependent oxidoreductase (luciferase family)